MRLIDADATIEDAFTIPDETSIIIKDACDAQPTVDAVPVIRCRACQWYEPDFGCDWGVCFHKEWTGGSIGHCVDADGYCYRAERKEE